MAVYIFMLYHGAVIYRVRIIDEISAIGRIIDNHLRYLLNDVLFPLFSALMKVAKD